MLQTVTTIFLLIMMIWIMCLIFYCLIHAIRASTITDRIVANNMIDTMVILVIGLLAIYMKEGYLMDIAIIYAMISFLAIVVLCKVYIVVWKKDKK
ncbi:MAG: monovalent cation/H+ antiporter complex subunit F [bacterium]|nr:monovalent cation/H+ antiporter complex subunit F [bacterium]